jgi:hypothetical protein
MAMEGMWSGPEFGSQDRVLFGGCESKGRELRGSSGVFVWTSWGIAGSSANAFLAPLDPASHRTWHLPSHVRAISSERDIFAHVLLVD